MLPWSFAGEPSGPGLVLGIALAVLTAIGVGQHLRTGHAARWTVAAGALVYAALLVVVTALPLPVSDAMACRSSASPHWLLVPGQMVVDAVSAVAQTGLLSRTTKYEAGLALGNIALFLPLGFLVAYAARRGLVVAALLGVIASVVLETVQMTALFGLFACPWRQADIDDTLMNTAGALMGWLVGWLIVRGAPGRGVEPLFTDSKSAVLPLDDPGPAGASGSRRNTRHPDEADEPSVNGDEVD